MSAETGVVPSVQKSPQPQQEDKGPQANEKIRQIHN